MVKALNWLIEAVLELIAKLLSALPESPFQWALGAVEPYAGYIAWFMPVSGIVSMTGAWLTGVVAWYGVRQIGKLVRMV